MSVCGQTGQIEEDSASEEVGASSRDLHKQKPASKVVRVLTVLAYLLSVSLAAILLSVYYVCAWKSPELPPINASEVAARHGNHTEYDTNFNYLTGGGDITVNGTASAQTASNAAGSTNSSAAGDVPTTLAFDTTTPLTTLQSLLNNSSLNGTSDDIGTFKETDSIT